MADKKQAYPVTILFLFILAGFLIYMVMVPSSERADILQSDENLDARANVKIYANSFSPEIVNIRSGETVSWTNKDVSKHRIIGVGFKSGILAPGQGYAHLFTEKGIYIYSCEFYPGMVGQVIVN